MLLQQQSLRRISKRYHIEPAPVLASKQSGIALSFLSRLQLHGRRATRRYVPSASDEGNTQLVFQRSGYPSSRLLLVGLKETPREDANSGKDKEGRRKIPLFYLTFAAFICSNLYLAATGGIFTGNSEYELWAQLVLSDSSLDRRGRHLHW